MTNLPLGTHVDAADPIAEALARGVDCVQIFIGPPQKWKGHEVAYPGGPQALREAAAEAGIGIYVHAPYIINVAAINNRVRIPSRKLLQTQIDLAAEDYGSMLITPEYFLRQMRAHAPDAVLHRFRASTWLGTQDEWVLHRLPT